MTLLVVCSACSRHVRSTEAQCPFCGARGAEQFARRITAPMERLSRAALYAVAMASVTAACGGSGAGAAPPASPPPSAQTEQPATTLATPEPQPGPTPATTAPVPPPPDGAVVAAYGGPPRPEQPVAVAPPPADKGKVEIANVTVKGGKIDNAPEVAEGMRAAFGRCYAKGLAVDPAAQGQVTLTIRIGAAGQVLGVSVNRTTNVPAQVGSCMTARAGGAEFAPPKAAKGQVTMDMTVNLTP